MAEEPDGFLGRWARRKQEVREGKPLSEPAPPAPDKARTLASVPPGSSTPPAGAAPAPAPEEKPAAPPPTLDEVKTLTHQSDFRRFVASDVDPEVKNAAMRKLFADPHFNVMDGLDIYIEDYNSPNPLPLAMLRQMTSAKVLGLVEDEDKDKQKTQPATGKELADNSTLPAQHADPAAQSESQTAAAQSPAATELPETDQDADPDLRLQQDHAAGPPGSGGRAQ